MIFYDGKNKVDIEIIDNNNNIDVTADLLEVEYMKYDEDNNRYIVDDIEYCIEYVKTEIKDDNTSIFINGKFL
ncbi:MAG: hypothetical protein ACI4VL_02335 [Bacilli bacterium]